MWRSAGTVIIAVVVVVVVVDVVVKTCNQARDATRDVEESKLERLGCRHTHGCSVLMPMCRR